ncbi:MAG: superoxide dismutase [Candidatus Sericytochromatia bacterium]
MNRRHMLKVLGGGALALTGLESLRQLPALAEVAKTPTPALTGSPGLLPLSFEPTRLSGLSARLLTSHHQNNYGGAVKRLGQIHSQLQALPATAAPFQVGALKREELIATNSILLHERYFEQLGAFHGPDGLLLKALEIQFGGFTDWLLSFKHLALSLAGGSGWALLYHHPVLGRFQTVAATEHSVGLAGGQILLALDMYEHAYHLDFGADAKSYIEAFFHHLDWRVVAHRYQKALVIADLLKSPSAAVGLQSSS